jgi:hypothetical protein
VVLPYIAEENRDEDPEVLVKPDEDTANAREVKEAIYAARGQVLLLNELQHNKSRTAQVAYSLDIQTPRWLKWYLSPRI